VRFEEHGTAKVSVRALSRRLGVSHAAPANHFPTKTALFGEIAREGFVKLGEAFTEAQHAFDNSSNSVELLENLGPDDRREVLIPDLMCERRDRGDISWGGDSLRGRDAHSRKPIPEPCPREPSQV
jgi:AcrR family transcriptional regulator